MIITYTNDPRVTNHINLDGTSYKTIVSCAREEVKTLESIAVSCGDTGCNVSITLNNGTSDFPIWNEVAMAANTTVIISDLHIKIRYRNDLSVGQLIKAKADTADKVTIIAVTIDHVPVKDNRGSSTNPGANVALGRASG